MARIARRVRERKREREGEGRRESRVNNIQRDGMKLRRLAMDQ